MIIDSLRVAAQKIAREQSACAARNMHVVQAKVAIWTDRTQSAIKLSGELGTSPLWQVTRSDPLS
jgi:hypothetical protein